MSVTAAGDISENPLSNEQCGSAIRKAQFKWVPEAPKIPGYYAAITPVMLGKLGEKGTELGTTNIHNAHQFETKEECERWIAENSPPAWRATEHGFY